MMCFGVGAGILNWDLPFDTYDKADAIHVEFFLVTNALSLASSRFHEENCDTFDSRTTPASDPTFE